MNTDARPILPVSDMSEAIRFYMGLGLMVSSPSDEYAWVFRGERELLHLRLVPDLDMGANRASAYLLVDHADEWHAIAEAGGLGPTPVRDEGWGMREFSVTDPSGNQLRVGCNL